MAHVLQEEMQLSCGHENESYTLRVATVWGILEQVKKKAMATCHSDAQYAWLSCVWMGLHEMDSQHGAVQKLTVRRGQYPDGVGGQGHSQRRWGWEGVLMCPAGVPQQLGGESMGQKAPKGRNSWRSYNYKALYIPLLAGVKWGFMKCAKQAVSKWLTIYSFGQSVK